MISNHSTSAPSGTLVPKSAIKQIAGIPCSITWGDWSRPQLDRLLAAMSTWPTRERLSAWAQAFVGTPFRFESDLLPLPRGTLRVNLADFDCVTFIYVVLALSLSDSFEEFVRSLALLRYDIPDERTSLDASMEHGNFLDFVEESLLERAVEQGWLADATSCFVPSASLLSLTVALQPVQRPAAFDENEQRVFPRRGNRSVTHTFVPSSVLGEIDLCNFEDGDLILFAKDPQHALGDLRHILVRHLAIVRKVGAEVLFVHASRNFSWRPNATKDTAPSHTGIFYDESRRCEQLGVAFCGTYAGDAFTLRTSKDTYFAMNQLNRRGLPEYALSNFAGVKVMRVIGSR